MAARKKSKKTSAKRGKPAARKAAPKPARPKAKARPKASRGDGDPSLVYSDIRRSLHGAILRSLR